MSTISEVNASKLTNAELVALHMIGNTPLVALQSEPRVKYTLHIPEQHYPPRESDRKLPILAVMHGGKADAIRQRNVWVDFARQMGIAILAPLFPVGMIDDDPWDFDAYRLLGRKPRRRRQAVQQIQQRTNGHNSPLHHDELLLQALDEVQARWPAPDASKIFISGFSAGSQFAHRFLYAHPQRVLGVAVGAPGFVTLLDESRPWPFGVADFNAQFGHPVDINAVVEVPILLLSGAEDLDPTTYIVRDRVHGPLPGLAASEVELRTSNVQLLSKSIGSQGAESVSEVLLPGVKHEMEKVQPAVAQWLQPLLHAWYSSPE